VLITGAASGIGRATALRAASEGADIAAIGLDGEALDALVDGIAGSVASGGLLVACHWLGASPDHKVHGSVVHERLHRRCASGFEHRNHRATPGYVLDAWRRR
jgi:NAD(P)-dependent dehydrogenase (short-subunit alcohol dehydrogenase family)